MERLFFQVVGNLAALPAVLAVLWLLFRRPGVVHVSELNIRIALALALLLTTFGVCLVVSGGVIVGLVGSAQGASVARVAAAGMTAMMLLALVGLAGWSFLTLPSTFKNKYHLLPIQDKQLTDRVKEIARLVGLKRSPKLEHSEYPVSPFVYGRPGHGYCLVLPSRFVDRINVAARSTGQDPKQIEGFVLCHELSHLRHGDVLLTSFAAVFSTPLLWWLGGSVLISIAATAMGQPELAVFALVWFFLAFVYLGLAPFSRHKELLADARAAVYFSPLSLPDAPTTMNLTWVAALEKVFTFPLSPVPALGFTSAARTNDVAQTRASSFAKLLSRLKLVLAQSVHPTIDQRRAAIDHGTFLVDRVPLPSLGAYAYNGLCCGLLYVATNALVYMALGFFHWVTGISGTEQALPLLNLQMAAMTLPVFSFVTPVMSSGKAFISTPTKAQTELIGQRIAIFWGAFFSVTGGLYTLVAGLQGLRFITIVTFLMLLLSAALAIAAVANVHRRNK